MPFRLLAAAALALVATACGPPAGEPSAGSEVEVGRMPTPPKRSEPLAPGYYPNPLRSEQRS